MSRINCILRVFLLIFSGRLSLHLRAGRHAAPATPDAEALLKRSDTVSQRLALVCGARQDHRL